jgi:hypothetical protein
VLHHQHKQTRAEVESCPDRTAPTGWGNINTDIEHDKIETCCRSELTHSASLAHTYTHTRTRARIHGESMSHVALIHDEARDCVLGSPMQSTTSTSELNRNSSDPTEHSHHQQARTTTCTSDRSVAKQQRTVLSTTEETAHHKNTHDDESCDDRLAHQHHAHTRTHTHTCATHGALTWDPKQETNSRTLTRIVVFWSAAAPHRASRGSADRSNMAEEFGESWFWKSDWNQTQSPWDAF